MEIFRFDALSGTVLEHLPMDLHGIVERFDKLLRDHLMKPIEREENQWLIEMQQRITVFYISDSKVCEIQPWVISHGHLCTCSGIYMELNRNPPLCRREEHGMDINWLVDWISRRESFILV